MADTTTTEKGKLMGLDAASGSEEQMASLPSVSNDDRTEDDSLLSYRHFWSNKPGRKETYKKGDVVMAGWKRFARWPYVVGNVNRKRKRVTLYDLSRNLPFAKKARPDVTVSTKKLEPYQKYHCDVSKNVSSQYASMFLRAINQADAIIQQNLDPFVDSVIANNDDVSENIAVDGSAETRSTNVSGEDSCQEQEESDRRDDTDSDIEILTTEPGSPNPSSARAIEYRRNQEILNAIKSDRTETHLVKVMRNEVASARRDEFLALLAVGRLGGRWFNCSPLSLENKIEETLTHLYDVKRKYEPDLCGVNGDAFAESVLLPEALNSCLKDVWGLTDEQMELSMAQPEYFFQLNLVCRDSTNNQ